MSSSSCATHTCSYNDKEGELCIICEDPLSPRIYDRVTRKLFICCGKEACLPCADAMVDNSSTNSTNNGGKLQVLCPNSNCRKPVPQTDEDQFALAKQMVDADEKLACYWAQSELANMFLSGKCFAEGTDRVANEDNFVKYMTLAADQRHHYAPAQISLGQYYYRQLTESSSGGGGGPPFPKCDAFERARELYLLAKHNKHLSANLLLGSLYHAVGDDAESLRYYKMGADEAGCNESSYYVGVYYQEVEESWDLAIPYFERAAKNGRADAQFALSQALMQQAKKLFMSWEIPGKSPVPRAMYWARRAVATESSSASSPSSDGLAQHYLTQMINLMKTRCAGCDAIDEDGFDKKCSRCKASFYCSRECQKNHWRAGHKIDCCDAAY